MLSFAEMDEQVEVHSAALQGPCLSHKDTGASFSRLDVSGRGQRRQVAPAEERDGSKRK